MANTVRTVNAAQHTLFSAYPHESLPGEASAWEGEDCIEQCYPDPVASGLCELVDGSPEFVDDCTILHGVGKLNAM